MTSPLFVFEKGRFLMNCGKYAVMRCHLWHERENARIFLFKVEILLAFAQDPEKLKFYIKTRLWAWAKAKILPEP